MEKKLEIKILKLKYILKKSKKGAPTSIRVPENFYEMIKYKDRKLQEIVDEALAYYLAFETDFNLED